MGIMVGLILVGLVMLTIAHREFNNEANERLTKVKIKSNRTTQNPRGNKKY